ncbi:MAG: hypothetical protein Q9227_004931 [Pyrenula ochraceoflavens]
MILTNSLLLQINNSQLATLTGMTPGSATTTFTSLRKKIRDLTAKGETVITYEKGSSGTGRPPKRKNNDADDDERELPETPKKKNGNNGGSKAPNNTPTTNSGNNNNNKKKAKTDKPAMATPDLRIKREQALTPGEEADAEDNGKSGDDGRSAAGTPMVNRARAGEAPSPSPSMQGSGKEGGKAKGKGAKLMPSKPIGKARGRMEKGNEKRGGEMDEDAEEGEKMENGGGEDEDEDEDEETIRVEK